MVRLEFIIELQYDVLDSADFIFNFAVAHTVAQKIVHEKLVANDIVKTDELRHEPQFGNRLLRLKVPRGPLQISYAGTVDIDHVFHDPAEIYQSPVDQLPIETLTFLRGTRYCPSDLLIQLAHGEFGHLPHNYERVEVIRQWVNKRTRFAIGTSTSATTAIDTLNEGRGVCRDFAHLMIALCRALNIPARFVTGLDHGADPILGPPDFHAYVEVWLGNRWYLFDPTGISPVTGLIRMATGADAADAAFCTIFGRAQSYMPQVYSNAIEANERGFVLPFHTALAVSTFGLRSSLHPFHSRLPATNRMPQAAAA